MTIRRYVRLALRLLCVWMVPGWAFGYWMTETPRPWRTATNLYGWPFAEKVNE